MMFRIKKLLSFEYIGFKENILLESPFAQVDTNGIGIKQVQIGITDNNLIIGEDRFDEINYLNLMKNHQQNKVQVDPEIESFQLSCMMPLDSLRFELKICNGRKVMKIDLAMQKNLFFEFGGYIMANTFWDLWQYQIRNLEKKFEMKAITYVPSPNSSKSVSKTYVVVADIHSNLKSSSSCDISYNSTSVKRNNVPSQLCSDGIYRICSNQSIKCQLTQKHKSSEKKSPLMKKPSNRNNKNFSTCFFETSSDILPSNGRVQFCDGTCQNVVYKSISAAYVSDFMNF